VAISDGRVSKVGEVRDRGAREIDAGGDPEALRTNRTPKFLRP